MLVLCTSLGLGALGVPSAVTASAPVIERPVATVMPGDDAGTRPVHSASAHLAEMVVFAPDEYADLLQEFLVWKHRKGYPADLHLISDVGSDTKSIQAWLRQLSEFYPREYILFVGDYEAIPSMMIEDAAGNTAPSDYLYTDLDADGSAGDGYIGRLPARTLDEARMMIARTMAYEREFGRDSDVDLGYLAEAIGIANEASARGRPNSDRVAAALQGLERLGMQVDARYFEGQPGWTREAFISDLKDGVGIVVALSTATGSGWRHAATPSFEFSAADLRALDNAGRWPLVIDLGGANASPDEAGDSMARAWAVAGTPDAPWGSIASIGLTGDVEDNAAALVPEAMVEFFAGGDTRLGAAVGHARSMILQQLGTDPSARSAAQLLTTFGDPSLVVRLAAPVPVEVRHETLVDLSDPLVRVEVEDEAGQPLPGVMVTNSFNDHFTYKQWTDAEGVCEVWPLDFGVEDGSVVDLVVTHPGIVAYEGRVAFFGEDTGDSDTGAEEDAGSATGSGSESDESGESGGSSTSTAGTESDDPSMTGDGQSTSGSEGEASGSSGEPGADDRASGDPSDAAEGCWMAGPRAARGDFEFTRWLGRRAAWILFQPTRTSRW